MKITEYLAFKYVSGENWRNNYKTGQRRLYFVSRFSKRDVLPLCIRIPYYQYIVLNDIAEQTVKFV